jgi:ArsR family transcriptional regulator
VATLEVPQPTVSRHLAALRRFGLVAVRKDGLWSHYRLAEPRSELHSRLLACLECCDGEDLKIRDDLARLTRVIAARKCCERPATR